MLDPCRRLRKYVSGILRFSGALYFRRNEGDTSIRTAGLPIYSARYVCFHQNSSYT